MPRPLWKVGAIDGHALSPADACPLDKVAAREEKGVGHEPISKRLSSAKLSLFSFAQFWLGPW